MLTTEVSSEEVEEDAQQGTPDVEHFGHSNEPTHMRPMPPVETSSEVVEERPQQQPADEGNFGVPQEAGIEGSAAGEAEPQETAAKQKPPSAKPDSEEAFSAAEPRRTFKPAPKPESSPKDLRSFTIVEPQDVEQKEPDSRDAAEDADDEPRTAIEDRPKRPPQVA